MRQLAAPLTVIALLLAITGCSSGRSDPSAGNDAAPSDTATLDPLPDTAPDAVRDTAPEDTLPDVAPLDPRCPPSLSEMSVGGSCSYPALTCVYTRAHECSCGTLVDYGCTCSTVYGDPFWDCPLGVDACQGACPEVQCPASRPQDGSHCPDWHMACQYEPSEVCPCGLTAKSVCQCKLDFTWTCYAPNCDALCTEPDGGV